MLRSPVHAVHPFWRLHPIQPTPQPEQECVLVVLSVKRSSSATGSWNIITRAPHCMQMNPLMRMHLRTFALLFTPSPGCQLVAVPPTIGPCETSPCSPCCQPECIPTHACAQPPVRIMPSMCHGEPVAAHPYEDRGSQCFLVGLGAQANGCPCRWNGCVRCMSCIATLTLAVQ